MIKIIFFILILLSSQIWADSINGWNELHKSVYEGNIHKTKQLIKKSDIDSQTKAGLTPLHIAVKKRDIAMLMLLLRAGADVDSQDNKGFTPLYYAVIQNRIKIARKLLQNEADPNLSNFIGNAPIHQIAYRNRFEMLDLFLNFEVNLKQKNNFGMLPYEFAQKGGNTHMMVELRNMTK